MLLKTRHTVVWCGHTCGQIVPHILSCAGFVFRDSGWSSSWSSQLLDQQCSCSEDRRVCGAPHGNIWHKGKAQFICWWFTSDVTAIYCSSYHMESWRPSLEHWNLLPQSPGHLRWGKQSAFSKSWRLPCSFLAQCHAQRSWGCRRPVTAPSMILLCVHLVYNVLCIYYVQCCGVTCN